MRGAGWQRSAGSGPTSDRAPTAALSSSALGQVFQIDSNQERRLPQQAIRSLVVGPRADRLAEGRVAHEGGAELLLGDAAVSVDVEELKDVRDRLVVELGELAQVVAELGVADLQRQGARWTTACECQVR